MFFAYFFLGFWKANSRVAPWVKREKSRGGRGFSSGFAVIGSHS